MRKLLLLITYLLIGIVTAQSQTPPIIYVAGDGTGDPGFNCDGIGDQEEINKALDSVAANPNFTTVYLKGVNIFEIDEPVLISNNTILTGDATATIKLKDNANWQTQNKPLITQTGRLGWDRYGIDGEMVSNVEIYGFRIDGGLFQVEPSGSEYNMLIHFTYPHNVSIHDMYFQYGQWDAIRLSSADNTTHIDCHIYNNKIYACGHDAISFVSVRFFEVYNNKIYKTRTNSGIRITECDSTYIHNNIIGNSLATPASGNAGIQIQNEVYPLNYTEVYDNVIYGKSVGITVGGEENVTVVYPTGTRKDVHIHHNRIYKTKSFDLGGGTVLESGIVINGFQNTLIENNVIDGSEVDGIVYKGVAGGGTGYQTIVRNNIIINNGNYGISNEQPSINTFIANNNLVYNNTTGNYNNVSSTDDINTYPMFGSAHSIINQWHHIVASYDNATETMKIFIDGTEKNSISYPGIFGTLPVNSYNFYLGADYNGNYMFDGREDELALWNRALTANEINSLYNNGAPQTITGALTNGMQAYLKMDNDWNDASGNGFDATNFTATFTTDAIAGTHAGLFNSTYVQYPTTLSTTNGFSISVWININALNRDVQTIVNKGNAADLDLIWLYLKGESLIFQLGNGSAVANLEAYIINPEDLDYHVKSEYGRWNGTVWVNDTVTSPCVDGGYPISNFDNEPTPNGGIINIGVYGNTAESSKSAPTTFIQESIKDNIVVYPNPTTGIIHFSKQLENEAYQITTLTRITVQEGIIKNKYIDLTNLTTGIYFIKITDNKTGEVKVAKIIKK